MSSHPALLIVIGTLITGLGLLVYFNDRKNSTNKIFALLTFSIVVWITTNYLCDNPSGANYALFWNKTAFASGALMAIMLFYFSLIFPRRFPNFTKFLEILFFSISGTLILLILTTPLFVERIEFYPWGTNIIGGSLFFIAVGWGIFCIGGLIVASILKYRISTGIEKTQMKYFFLGLAIFTISGMTTNLILPSITGTNELAKFGPYPMIFLLGFTAYAILKHHLLNIRVIATESLVFLLSLILFIETLLSKTLVEGILRTIFLILVIYGGYALVKSVIREIKFREELQVMTEQLAHANSHLKELDQMKTEFVSLASHELLTPVSAIEGYLSMLLDEHMAKVEDPKAQKYLHNVYSSAKRLARLIADMLNIARIEEGRLLVEKKDINLNELIEQAIAEIHFKAEEKKQRIEFEKPPFAKATEGVSTYGDADKLKEVIINLIGNSIKYSKNPGTITIRIEKVPTAWVAEKWQKIEEDIKQRPLDDQEAIHSAVDEHFRNFVGQTQLMIAVQDQGIGIPKEELSRLFKKFHRVGDYTTAESQGTGLGLYISRALVELHHGRIWADSEGEGKGSTFTFTLPDISDKEELLRMEAQAPKKESLKPLARPTKEAEDI